MQYTVHWLEVVMKIKEFHIIITPSSDKVHQQEKKNNKMNQAKLNTNQMDSVSKN